MNLRTLIHTRLTSDAPLVAMVGDRIAQGSSVNDPPTRPFLIHRLLNSAAEGGKLGESRYLQFWAHDEPGDYQKIDDILARVKLVMIGTTSFQELLEITWIEDSQDFRDNDFGTICRYSRYQAVFTTRERMDPWT